MKRELLILWVSEAAYVGVGDAASKFGYIWIG